MTPLIPRKVHSFRNYNGGAGMGVYRGGMLRKTRIAHVASAVRYSEVREPSR